MTIEVLLAGNQERLEEVECCFKLFKYPDVFTVKRHAAAGHIYDELGWTVVFFSLQCGSDEDDLRSLLEVSKNRRVNVVVESRVDDGRLALKWVGLGAFWVVSDAQWGRLERLATIIRAAALSRDSRSQLFQDLKSKPAEKLLNPSSGQVRCFVSMNLRECHEDGSALELALRPLCNHLPVDIRSAVDHPDSGHQSLRERIAGHIREADICIAFLSPTGRMSERFFLYGLLSHIPYLRRITQNDLRSESSIEEFGAETLAELLKCSGEIDRSDLFLQSPSVMWEVGFAFALSKTIVFLCKSEYVGLTISPPAMTVGSYRVEFENHIDLALRLYFGLKQDLTRVC